MKYALSWFFVKLIFFCFKNFLHCQGWFGSTKMKSVIGFDKIVSILHKNNAPPDVSVCCCYVVVVMLLLLLCYVVGVMFPWNFASDVMEKLKHRKCVKADIFFRTWVPKSREWCSLILAESTTMETLAVPTPLAKLDLFSRRTNREIGQSLSCL